MQFRSSLKAKKIQNLFHILLVVWHNSFKNLFVEFQFLFVRLIIHRIQVNNIRINLKWNQWSSNKKTPVKVIFTNVRKLNSKKKRIKKRWIFRHINIPLFKKSTSVPNYTSRLHALWFLNFFSNIFYKKLFRCRLSNIYRRDFLSLLWIPSHRNIWP